MGCGASGPQKSTIRLPSEEPNEKAKEQRKSDLEAQAALYEYAIDKDSTGKALPPRPLKLPDEEDHDAHLLEQLWDAGQIKASLEFNGALDFVTEIFTDDAPFKDFSDLYRAGTLPDVAKNDRWREDVEFARQRVMGLNPTVITRLAAPLPDSRLPVTDEMLAKLLPPKRPSLQKLAQDGRLFVCDYAEIDTLRPQIPDDRAVCAPIALFAVNDDDILMPLCIQLNQAPGAENPIFTPDADHTQPGAWLAAKIHTNVADLFLHEVGAHLMQSHLFAEGVYLSMMRNVHKTHVISSLIRPHFWGTMAVNFNGRKVLLGDDAVMPRLLAPGHAATAALLSKWNEGFSIADRMDFPAISAKRGLAGIPHNPYNDDSLALFAVIKSYVDGILKLAYADGDEAVAKDPELKAWVAELTGKLGAKDLPGAHGHTHIKTLSALTELITAVIFNQTGHHAAVNGPQWDYVGYIPNAPGRFRMPPPTKVDEPITDAAIAKCLPNYEDSVEQIVVVKTLSGEPSDKALMLGHFPSGHLSGLEGADAVLEEFQKGLDGLRKSIGHRNNAARDEFAYKYLHPDNICSSVCM